MWRPSMRVCKVGRLAESKAGHFISKLMMLLANGPRIVGVRIPHPGVGLLTDRSSKLAWTIVPNLGDAT
jgi:hypothetical protein